MGTVPAIHIYIQSFVTAFFVHTPKFFQFLAVATNLNLGEPWDQVRLPQPAWSLHEDDLLQTLDWESHWGKLFLEIYFSYFHCPDQETLDEDTILWSINDQLQI